MIFFSDSICYNSIVQATSLKQWPTTQFTGADHKASDHKASVGDDRQHKKKLCMLINSICEHQIVNLFMKYSGDPL